MIVLYTFKFFIEKIDFNIFSIKYTISILHTNTNRYRKHLWKIT